MILVLIMVPMLVLMLGAVAQRHCGMFLHGLCVAPRLPPMAPVNLGTCNITPKSTVLTAIAGAIVATGAFGPNGKASFASILRLGAGTSEIKFNRCSRVCEPAPNLCRALE